MCTGASDENLKFWRLWDLTAENNRKKKEMVDANRRVNSTSATALAIR